MMRWLACFVAAACAAGAHALQVSDDRGAAFALGRPPARIVALSPHLAEIAFAAGAGAKLVGVSSFSNFPEEARRLPVVASYGRVDFERLIAARPELVLAWGSGNPALQVGHLERLGLRVAVTEVRRLADIPRVVRLVGALAGSEAAAEESARRFERAVAALRERYAARREVAVFVEIWHQPLLTVNGGHLISDALRLCGGRNVFERAGILTPVVSREQLLAARPAVIVTDSAAGQAASWRGLEAVPAVKAGRIYAIDPDLLDAQGPRFVEGARALCRHLDLARE